jgi:hypothetical protein
MTVLTVNNLPAATHGETVRCLFLCRMGNYAGPSCVSPAGTALGWHPCGIVSEPKTDARL